MTFTERTNGVNVNQSIIVNLISKDTDDPVKYTVDAIQNQIINNLSVDLVNTINSLANTQNNVSNQAFDINNLRQEVITNKVSSNEGVINALDSTTINTNILNTQVLNTNELNVVNIVSNSIVTNKLYVNDVVEGLEVNDGFISNSIFDNVFIRSSRSDTLNVSNLIAENLYTNVNVPLLNSSTALGFDENGKVIPVKIEPEIIFEPNASYLYTNAEGYAKPGTAEREVKASYNLITAWAVNNMKYGLELAITENTNRVNNTINAMNNIIYQTSSDVNNALWSVNNALYIVNQIQNNWNVMDNRVNNLNTEISIVNSSAKGYANNAYNNAIAYTNNALLNIDLNLAYQYTDNKANEAYNNAIAYTNNAMHNIDLNLAYQYADNKANEAYNNAVNLVQEGYVTQTIYNNEVNNIYNALNNIDLNNIYSYTNEKTEEAYNNAINFVQNGYVEKETFNTEINGIHNEINNISLSSLYCNTLEGFEFRNGLANVKVFAKSPILDGGYGTYEVTATDPCSADIDDDTGIVTFYSQKPFIGFGSYVNLFRDCPNFNSAVSISEGITNTLGAFANCANLGKNIIIPSTVVDTSQMFMDTPYYYNSNFNFSAYPNLKNSSLMFSGVNVDFNVSGLPVNGVDTMGMFKGCGNINLLAHYDSSTDYVWFENCNDISSMFSNDNTLIKKNRGLNLSIKINNVNNASDLFGNVTFEEGLNFDWFYLSNCNNYNNIIATNLVPRKQITLSNVAFEDNILSEIGFNWGSSPNEYSPVLALYNVNIVGEPHLFNDGWFNKSTYGGGRPYFIIENTNGTLSRMFNNTKLSIPVSIKNCNINNMTDFMNNGSVLSMGFRNVTFEDNTNFVYAFRGNSLNNVEEPRLDCNFNNCNFNNANGSYMFEYRYLYKPVAIPKGFNVCFSMFRNAGYQIMTDGLDYVIPEGVTNISYAFAGTPFNAKDFIIPSSLSHAGATFENCSRFNANIIIPEDSGLSYVTAMFNKCETFNKPVNFPNTVASIWRTFGYCNNFNSPVTFGNRITTMAFAFQSSINFNQPISPIPETCSNMTCTFQGTSFNQPINIPQGVDSMYRTFMSSKFNQDITLNGILNAFETLKEATKLDKNVNIINCQNAKGTLYKVGNLDTLYVDNIDWNAEDPGTMSFYSSVNNGLPNNIIIKNVSDIPSVFDTTNNIPNQSVAFLGIDKNTVMNVNHVVFENINSIAYTLTTNSLKPVTSINTLEIRNVNKAYGLFYRSHNLTINNVVIKDCLNIGPAFANCYIFNPDSMIIENVDSLPWTFSGCNGLNVRNLTFRNVNSIVGALNGCTNQKETWYIDCFEAGKGSDHLSTRINNAVLHFENCFEFNNSFAQYSSDVITQKIYFNNCDVIRNVSKTAVNSWGINAKVRGVDVNNVNDCSRMFENYSTSLFVSRDLAAPEINFNNVGTLYKAFGNTNNIFEDGFSVKFSVNIRNCYNMNSMFANTKNIPIVRINAADNTTVDLSRMFWNASLSSSSYVYTNGNNVKYNMTYLYYNCQNLNTYDTNLINNAFDASHVYEACYKIPTNKLIVPENAVTCAFMYSRVSFNFSSSNLYIYTPKDREITIANYAKTLVGPKDAAVNNIIAGTIPASHSYFHINRLRNVDASDPIANGLNNGYIVQYKLNIKNASAVTPLNIPFEMIINDL